MAAKSTLIVELTSDEKRLLDGFRKSQAADDDFRAGLKKTGMEMESTGKAMVDAMLGAAKSSEVASDKIVKQLRGAGAEGKKLFGELSKTGKQSVDDILKKLDKVDSKLSAQARNILAEWSKVDQANKFEKTRAELDALGGDFKALGGEIKKAVEIPEDRIAAARQLVDELRKIDPTKADMIAKAMERARESVYQTRLDQFVSKLAGGNREAQELAKVLGVDMKDASLAAEGGIDGIAKKIIALRPELEASVNKWKADMAEAAKFGEGQYKQALDALRAGDKISQQVAEDIKSHLVSAGKIVERTFEDMIKPLEKINPTLAAEAKKWHKELEENEKKSKGSFGRISKYAIAEIASIATAYIGIQEAVQFVTETMREQQAVLQKASDSQKTLAAAQKDAQKNLAKFSEDHQKSLLLELVPATAKAAVFSDLAGLTKAIGDTASAGGTFEQIQQILPIAAGLTRETPDFVDETATAMADALYATKEKDVRLAVTKDLLTGSMSRVTDPGKLLRNLAPVKVAASEAVPEALRIESAMQSQAAFAAFTKAGADPQGDASQTAVIQFMARLRGFFKDLGKDATKAQAELDALKDPITATDRHRLSVLSDKEARAEQTSAQIQTLREQREAIQNRLDYEDIDSGTRRSLSVEKRRLTERLTGLRRVEFTDDERAQLSDLRMRIGDKEESYQAKRSELEGRIAAAQIKGFKGKAPILLFDQIRAIQNNPVLAEAFGDVSFGEQRFRSAGEQFISGGTAFQTALQTYDLLKREGRDTSIIDRLLSQERFLTPQQETAFLREKSAVGEAIRLGFDTYGGSMGQQREDLARTLAENRSDGYLSPFIEAFDETGIRSGFSLYGGTRLEETVSSIGKLARRRSAIRSGGVTELEAPRLQNIENEIDTFLRRVSSSISLSESPETLQALDSKYSRIGSAIRRNDYSRLSNGEFQSVNGNQAVFLRLEQALSDLAELQRLQLEAAKETAANTSPNQRRPTDSMRDSARASDRRRAP
ncbi:hypothetical protein Mal15_21950 [Stieleria maiorica]|uniref:Uncharacterized protein n=1 Tax=Stieleria maiorica TaxID=2795974 RepID=A0A5B9MGB8_9BACT|nr:hypothetical protein [Stieleria maiorica]QEF98147.1 hypothetical protein Mal15_21950 [Stieleria maiorica]